MEVSAIFSIILPIVSLVITVGTICICIGVYKTKLEMCERNINGIGEKLSKVAKEIRDEQHSVNKEIRDEHIKPLREKINANYGSLIQMGKIQERLETILKEIIRRLDKIETKLEKNL